MQSRVVQRAVVLVLVAGLGLTGALGFLAGDSDPSPPADRLSAGGGDTSPEDPAPVAGQATVVRVVDGDTIVVAIAGSEERVRLIGIDTPESVDPRRPVQCYGKEASARAAALLPPGTDVRLVRDVEARDAYDRLLAYVYRLPDDVFINLTLAREGYAAAATYPPNVAHADEFAAAAATARQEQRGLWGACGGPDEPAE